MLQSDWGSRAARIPSQHARCVVRLRIRRVDSSVQRAEHRPGKELGASVTSVMSQCLGRTGPSGGARRLRVLRRAKMRHHFLGPSLLWQLRQLRCYDGCEREPGLLVRGAFARMQLKQRHELQILRPTENRGAPKTIPTPLGRS